MKNLFLATCLVCLFIPVSQAQDKEDSKGNSPQQENLYFKLKDGAKPDIYIDGKKYDYAILDLLDQSKIESVSVLKDEVAMKDYNASNGVILITTKKKAESSKAEVKIKSLDDGSLPLIIIDGEISSKEALGKIAPDNIENISVFKGEKAIKKYNAPNGAIVVTTKESGK